MFEVDAVDCYERATPLLIAHAIDQPSSGSFDSHALFVEGWVLERDASVRSVNITCGDTVVADAIVRRPTPGVADTFPQFPRAASCGFWAEVGALDLQLDWSLEVNAELEDGSRHSLGRIRGHRSPVRGDFRPRVHPLVLTSIGRSGSVWFARLLSAHPDVLVYRPFQFEPKFASYWMDVLRTLARPSSYTGAIDPIGMTTNPTWWDGTERPAVALPDAELDRYLGREHVEALTSFCQDRLEGFYLRVAALQGRRRPRFFLERFAPDTNPPELILELYPRAREVFLVRDPRDTLCSFAAFAAKRGRAVLGRDPLPIGEQLMTLLAARALALRDAWTSRSARAHLVHYEDLILEPAATLRALLDFLDLDASEQQIAGMLELAQSEMPEMTTHRTSSTVADSVGRWRHELDPAAVSLCDEILGPAFAAFGY